MNLEPESKNTDSHIGWDVALSQAISLKRIADKLDILVKLMREDRSTGHPDLDAIRRKYGAV